MRLTRKQKFVFTVGKNGEAKEREVIVIDDHKLAEEKLYQLEDIEEELGIDLITLFKALKNGITYRTPLGNNFAYTILTNDRLSIEYKWKCLRKGTQKFYFKDYGKTWAVTTEELE